MLEPKPLESTSPVNRALMAADLDRLAQELVAAFVPLMAPDLGLAGKLLRLAPEKASSLLGSDLNPRISALLVRTLALPDDELALLVDSIAIRLAGWRGLYALQPVTPALAAAIDHVRAIVRA